MTVRSRLRNLIAPVFKHAPKFRTWLVNADRGLIYCDILWREWCRKLFEQIPKVYLSH